IAAVALAVGLWLAFRSPSSENTAKIAEGPPPGEGTKGTIEKKPAPDEPAQPGGVIEEESSDAERFPVSPPRIERSRPKPPPEPREAVAAWLPPPTTATRTLKVQYQCK